MVKKALVAMLLCAALVNMAVAHDKVAVVAGPFIGVINEDGTGPYQLILNEAAKRAGIELSEDVYPLKRALKAFVNKDALAIYGMTKSVVDKVGADNIITSYPIGVYKLYVFTKKGSPSITSYTQLKGKTVGGVSGYEGLYPELTDRGIEVTYFANEEFQLRRLEAGRVDAIIGYMPDWIPFLDQLSYDPSFPVRVGYDFMTAWNTPEGVAFVDKISPVLRNMKSDGTSKKILGDRYMDFEYSATEKYWWVDDQ